MREMAMARERERERENRFLTTIVLKLLDVTGCYWTGIVGAVRFVDSNSNLGHSKGALFKSKKSGPFGDLGSSPTRLDRP